MLLKICFALVLIAGVIALLAARQPGTFTVSRSARIQATPSAIFARINHLERFQTWNPWAKIDPSMTGSYSGPAEGVGAAYAWSGNSQVGQGRMTIVESEPQRRVRLKMEFLKPLQSTSSAEFLLEPDGDATRVTWTMSGPQTIPGRVIGVFANMERLIGTQFERGLAQMKAQAETAPIAQR